MTVHTAAGAALIVIALLVNPWFLESFVVLDESITRKWPVVVVEVVTAAFGLLLVQSGRAPSKRQLSIRDRLFAGIAIGFALVFSLIAGEVVLRLFVGPEILLKPEKASEYRWRARQAGYESGTQEGRYDYDLFDPLLGWLPKKNYSHGGVTTNSLGIRSTREYSFERVAGVRRIVLIGDSFTWGEATWSSEISNEETFATRLETDLPNTEALNLGVHGWGTDQQLIYLYELGLRFQPDLVILGFFEANLERNVATFHGYSKPRFFLEDGALVLRNTPILDGEAFLETPFELPSFYLGKLIGKGASAVLDRTKFRPIEGREAWHITQAIFEAAKRKSEAAGAEFLLVDIPFGVRRPATSIERAVTKWAADSETHYVSLREHFIGLPRTEWSKINDGHFTVRGHAETAKALIGYIENANLLPTEDMAGRKSSN